MNQPITWLHLSDAHFGNPEHDRDIQSVLVALIRDLKKLEREREIHPDFIVFTGDAAWGERGEIPMKDQYSQFAKFLDGVRGCFEVQVPKGRVFIVPGNHDVNRKVAGPEQIGWLRGLTGDDGAAGIQKMWKEDTNTRRRFMERLEAFREFLVDAEYNHLLDKDGTRMNFSSSFDVRGTQVGVAGLNSAWSSSEDAEKGNLWLGKWQINALHGDLQHCDMKLVLSHHPTNWLNEYEDPLINRMIAQKFDFFLHGHEHSRWVSSESGHTRVAAAACYGGEKNGYNVVQVFDEEVKIHLRSYEAQGGGWIPQQIYNQTVGDGTGIWTLTRQDKTKNVRLDPGWKPIPVSRAPQEEPSTERIDAYDYFSPAAEILDEGRFIGRRDELEKALRALRSSGAHIAVIGQPGCGKSSLAKQIAYVAAGEHESLIQRLDLRRLEPIGGFRHPVVTYSCSAEDQSIEDLLKSVLCDATPPFSMSTLLESTEVQERSKLPENRTLRDKLETLREGKSLPKSVRVSQLFAGVASLIASAAKGDERSSESGSSLVVVLDEFDRVVDRDGMAPLMKELHAVTFVVVGTALDVRILVQEHGSVPRQLAEGQVRVNPMSEEEIVEIIVHEQGRSGDRFEFESEAVREVAKLSSGMPYFAHFLGRYGLDEALQEPDREPGTCIVSQRHVTNAISRLVEGVSDPENTYNRVVRGSWQREFVLKLLASRSEREIYAGNIADVAKYQGVRDVMPQIKYFVKEGVLEQTQHKTYRFFDPRFRVWARMRDPMEDKVTMRLRAIRAHPQYRSIQGFTWAN